MSLGIDKKDRGVESIENVSKGGGFGLSEINDLTCAHGPAHMRHEKSHAPTHFIIHHAARLVAEDGQIRTAAR